MEGRSQRGGSVVINNSLQQKNLVGARCDLKRTADFVNCLSEGFYHRPQHTTFHPFFTHTPNVNQTSTQPLPWWCPRTSQLSVLLIQQIEVELFNLVR